MHFGIPILIFGLYLLLVPLIVHLINMMRHRRVQWAAMDFLLASYKKHRNYVWLKQLLLLLSRIAALLLLVALASQFQGCENDLVAKIGGTVTHHYILIDDSFSMSDISGGRQSDAAGPDRAIDRAKRVLAELTSNAIESNTPQKFTIIRFSRAAQLGEEASPETILSVADMNAMVVGTGLTAAVEEVRNSFDVTELAVGPGPAIDAVLQLIQGGQDEESRVLILSDFRAEQWSNPTEIQEKLEQLHNREADLHFVHCVETARDNLAITRIEPEQGSHAAGVPLFVHVTVTNYGEDPALNVGVDIETTEYVDIATPLLERQEGSTRAVSSINFNNIPPGRSSTGKVQVFFPSSGQHVVQATLPPDIIEADNSRWCIVDLPEAVPVLLVEGSEASLGAGSHSFYLNTLFNPSGRGQEEPSARIQTGIRSESRSAGFLRDSSPEELHKYYAIYLLDVPRLETRALSNLKAYVGNGGGLFICMGSQCDLDYYNQMHDDGEGLFPAGLPGEGLERVAELPRQLDDQVPDLEITNHPLFKVFQGEVNTLLRDVIIHRYIRTAPDWEPNAEQGSAVLARVRGSRKPLLVEKRYGEGMVVAFMSTLAPRWNNWATEPTFVVFQLEMQKYLTSSRRGTLFRPVGSPVSLLYDAGEYENTFHVSLPKDASDEAALHAIEASPPAADSNNYSLVMSNDAPLLAGGGVDHAGIYEIWAQHLQHDESGANRPTAGMYEVDRFALNVSPTEGNTELVSSEALQAIFETLPIRYHASGAMGHISTERSGSWGHLLLAILIGLLLLEQALAYWTSYHPSKRAIA